jgi:glycosyltransferase involved in cell wall biosynthesis
VTVPGPPSSLRIALLCYRGNPFSGGQGVYTRNLARELVALGHRVEVFAGQPYPVLDEGVGFTPVPSLDLYREPDPFRTPRPGEFRDRIDLLEVATMWTAGFPEPRTFALRAARLLATRSAEFDLVHDNQCLGYGLLKLPAYGLPIMATIHHPVRVDRRLELAEAKGLRQITLRRWYAFTKMQARVARKLPEIITVSSSSAAQITEYMGVRPERISTIPIGTDVDRYRPDPARTGTAGRIVTTASADSPLKGLAVLIEAFAKVRADHDHAHLTVVGKPKKGGPALRAIEELGLSGSVTFTDGLTEDELIDTLRSAEIACVPSLYEGFSLPAVEAMALGLPLVATTGGALPEVTGPDGLAALTVPPGDAPALAAALSRLLGDPQLRARLGAAARERAVTKFTWRAAATATAERYRFQVEAAAEAAGGGGRGTDRCTVTPNAFAKPAANATAAANAVDIRTADAEATSIAGAVAPELVAAASPKPSRWPRALSPARPIKPNTLTTLAEPAQPAEPTSLAALAESGASLGQTSLLESPGLSGLAADLATLTNPSAPPGPGAQLESPALTGPTAAAPADTTGPITPADPAGAPPEILDLGAAPAPADPSQKGHLAC